MKVHLTNDIALRRLWDGRSKGMTVRLPQNNLQIAYKTVYNFLFFFFNYTHPVGVGDGA